MLQKSQQRLFSYNKVLNREIVRLTQAKNIDVTTKNCFKAAIPSLEGSTREVIVLETALGVGSDSATSCLAI